MWLAHRHRIDHSALADFRKNTASALKKFNADLVRLGKKLGVIKIAELSVDPTRIEAKDSRSRLMPAAKATKHFKIIDPIFEALMELTTAAGRDDELLGDAAQGEQILGALANLHRRTE